MGLLRVKFLQKELRLNLDVKQRGNFLPPFLLGLTFAFGWTPCIGPILGSILAIIAQDASVFRGLILMIFYSLGLSLPFIGLSYLLIKGVVITAVISNYSLYIERFTGGFLLLIGLLFLSGSFQLLGFFILEYLPFLSVFG
jgi:cytochrome c-type biogenesis protein